MHAPARESRMGCGRRDSKEDSREEWEAEQESTGFRGDLHGEQRGKQDGKKNEDQSVDTSLLLRMGNTIPMEGVRETKFRAEGKTIQRLPLLGIHPIETPNPDTIVHASKILLTGP